MSYNSTNSSETHSEWFVGFNLKYFLATSVECSEYNMFYGTFSRAVDDVNVKIFSAEQRTKGDNFHRANQGTPGP
jgi:hypothetical protein